jgi:hypothetical protein
LGHPAFGLETGTICVAPLPQPVDGRRGAGPETVVCDADKYSVKIDLRQPVSWPIKESAKITGLELAAPHRVVVLCDGKSRQSFKFHFSEFKSQKLCLFLNDLYWTVQLWQDKQCPWCKCK